VGLSLALVRVGLTRAGGITAHGCMMRFTSGGSTQMAGGQLRRYVNQPGNGLI
jgi:hypothetical protein